MLLLALAPVSVSPCQGVSLKCVVNVFRRTKILSAYKLRANRRMSDDIVHLRIIIYVIFRGQDAEKKLTFCVMEWAVRECEGEERESIGGKRMTNPMGNCSRIPQWFCKNVDVNLHALRMTCIWKQSNLVRLAKQTTFSVSNWRKLERKSFNYASYVIKITAVHFAVVLVTNSNGALQMYSTPALCLNFFLLVHAHDCVA